ncbi:DJ-1 family glyoxalase III [Actinomyces capricornis]|uniref:4-methyl-5(B-hydroxyethyl)-thiazole monophosphate biosynthesis protein n=1 Tax=Actinomyces capricornis TaxID=2755559 RepID=A0ABN6KA14_9ACTO|nr:DJ-1 family glyoxalase III [Actinomyces capricornis]BDA64935.1 4-methyl-5(B-hydroxyethyl)-thiazole monophosphate biosynthesis protein [Actinomyces capricornis]
MPDFQATTDKKVAVFIAPGLEEVEALAVVDLLFRAGIATDMISVTQDRSVVSSHNIIVTCNRTLDEADLADYDMLVLPGGLPGTPNLKACRPLMDEVRSRVEAGRPVAAICAAPSILAELGLLEGREATSNPGFLGVLADHGARTSEASVVIDGSIITSRGMGTAIDFGLEIVRHYLGDEAVEALKTAIVYQG